MRRALLFIISIWFALGTSASAQSDDRAFRVAVPDELVDSGLMAHVLPRFSLKTSRRADITPEAPDAMIGPEGIPVFARGDVAYALALVTEDADARAFLDWLQSTAGQSAVTGFVPSSGSAFTAIVAAPVAEPIMFEGDIAKGLAVAEVHCTRCHTVAPGDRSNIASTPSFMALRALPDWDQRFAAFFALNPHPAFLRVEGLSPPFDPSRPPSMIPIVISEAEMEDVQAYAASLAPAELGKDVEAR